MSIHTEGRTARVALWPHGGRCRVELAAGLLAPRVIRHDAAGAHVALVATTATLLGGDRLVLDLEVGPGLRLDLHDVAGTVAYHGRGLGCRVEVTVRVHEGALLTWAGQPVVVAEGSELSRTMRVDVAHGGRLLMRDQLVLGRSGEVGGSLRCQTRMMYAGRPALAEDLHLGDGVGELGDARVVDTMTAVGWRPVVPAPPRDLGPASVAVFSLDAPGSLARALVPAAHHSRIPGLWDTWARQVAQT